jgi:hypothetical protein
VKNIYFLRSYKMKKIVLSTIGEMRGNSICPGTVLKMLYLLAFTKAAIVCDSTVIPIRKDWKEDTRKTGNKNATSHIIQAISMTVQRGNATSIMGTLIQNSAFGVVLDCSISR